MAGADELCDALTVGTASSATATAPSTPIVVSSPVAKKLLRLHAPVLQRLPSQPLTLRAAVPPAVAADEDDGEDDEEDHEMETAESAEGGGERCTSGCMPRGVAVFFCTVRSALLRP